MTENDSPVSNILPKTDICYVISLPSSGDRRRWIMEHFREQYMPFVFSDGVTVDPDVLSFQETKGLEGYNKYAHEKDYQARAVGCRRAGLNCLIEGVQFSKKQGGKGFLVCQDDVRLSKDFKRKAEICLRELPEIAKLLWFDRSQITQQEESYSLHLRKNYGSRLCTCFWISREFAEEIIPKLKQADTEWDIFMEEQMKSLNGEGSYISSSSLAKQKSGVSLITGKRKWSQGYNMLSMFKKRGISFWKHLQKHIP